MLPSALPIANSIDERKLMKFRRDGVLLMANGQIVTGDARCVRIQADGFETELDISSGLK